jgi:hypothetical protein
MSEIGESSTQNTSGIVVGNPVTGDDFFGREPEIEDFIEDLERGDQILISAPRRTGKTSLLMETSRRLSDRYFCLYVDVQACTSEVDAIVKLAMEAKTIRELSRIVLDAFRNFIGAVLDRIDEIKAAEFELKLREGVTADWRTRGNELLERLSRADKPIVVFLDELPILVNVLLKGEDLRITPARRQQTHVFLSWLREATVRYRGRLRFVACGSIGLEPLLSQAGISETMNTFKPFLLQPWSRKTALAFLHDRARRTGIEFLNGAENHLLDLLELFVPHHVQMFLSYIHRDTKHRDPHTCSIEDVNRLYREKMLSIHGHIELATYEDRLKRVVPRELLDVALELLTEAAVVGSLTPHAASHIIRTGLPAEANAAAELRFLLALFTHDGYLRQSGNDYRFVSRLLRDWWKQRFEFGYVPVAQRDKEAE